MANFKDSIKEGEQGEKRFKNIIESFGLLAREASFKENVHDHIDFFVNGETEKLKDFKFSVDVKARKRKSRGSDRYDDEYTWIEFKNVQGKKGWLYGKADKIAFEVEDGFLMIDREELVKWCEEKVDFKKSVRTAASATYKVYTRKGRDDLITRIKTEDIRNLNSCRLLA
jgi:hypothetical protein|tara:strand:- start:124 stop:633 length:510 start_codon:yes stop_codon:yes gene_type:complete